MVDNRLIFPASDPARRLLRFKAEAAIGFPRAVKKSRFERKEANREVEPKRRPPAAIRAGDDARRARRKHRPFG
jgi:hypothetical protein